MKTIFSLMLLCATIIFASCQKNDITVSVESVTLSRNTITIEVGKTELLTATITPEILGDKAINWTSNDVTIATVSETGLVIGLKAGTTTIAATSIDDHTKKAICTVTVTDAVIDITGITLNNSILALEVGKAEVLTATVAPDNATNKAINWTSNDVTIATVSETGLVIGLKAGTTTIAATSIDDYTKKAICTVTVTDAVIVVTSIALNKNILALEVDQTEALVATVAPDNATYKAVSWTSSDVTIAGVSETGLVTALNIGVATITATSMGDNTKTETCTVTVDADIQDAFSVGDYYPAGSTKENAVGVVFWISSKYGTKGKIVSMDEATKSWVTAKSWAKGKSDGSMNWTCPTKDELQHLWCAYNGVSPLVWVDGINDNAPANTDAQMAFNSKLIIPLTENYYWSSSEYSIEHGWFVYLGDGSTHFTKKVAETNVRAVANF